MSRYIYILILYQFALLCKAQDAHFSQFQTNFLYNSPSNTGMFDYEHYKNTIRVASIFRQQWRSIESPYLSQKTPYITSHFSVDGNISNMSWLGDNMIGIGISTLYDQAGDLNLSTRQIGTFLAYHQSISYNADKFLSIGFNYTFVNKSLDLSKATFDSQWNGKEYVPTNANGEPLYHNSINYGDLGTGVGLSWLPHYGINFKSHFAYLHVNQANQKFIKQNIVSSKIYPLFSFTHDMVIPLKSNWSIVPLLILMKQGPATESIFNASFRYSEQTDKYFQLGIGYRLVGKYNNTIATDALYPMLKYNYNKWTFGLSYDINISNLTPATNNKGAIEFSILYHNRPFSKAPNKHKSKIKCPPTHPQFRKKSQNQ